MWCMRPRPLGLLNEEQSMLEANAYSDYIHYKGWV
jgi:hypothetical protein